MAALIAVLIQAACCASFAAAPSSREPQAAPRPAKARTKLPAAGAPKAAGPGSSAAALTQFFGLSVLDFEHKKPNLRFGTTRIWDVYPGVSWPDFNPAPEKFNFVTLDKYLDLAERDRRDVIYTFGRTPRWASTQPAVAGAYGPGECAAPNLPAWDAYVTAIVTHARGRIRLWELWNEPDQPRFFCGDIPAMVTMAQHAYATIKRIDPSATVLSPAASGGEGAGWLAKFIAAGGRKTFDAVAFHGYEGIHAESIVPIVAVYRHALASFDLVGTPLIDTECNWADNAVGDDAHRAAFLAKYFILQWSEGVSRVVWYAYDGEPQWGRLIDGKENLLPDGVAFAETYKWLVGATPSRPCAQAAEGTWRCELTRPGGYRAEILWNSTAPTDINSAVGASMTEFRDLSGKVSPVMNGSVAVGNKPILVESKSLPE